MEPSEHGNGVSSSYSQELDASQHVERSKFLEEYSQARPQSAGTARPRSIIHRFGRPLLADDCDLDAEPEPASASWVLDGWGDEPSVPDKVRMNSFKVSKYCRDVPSALPNANPRRVLSAGGNSRSNQKASGKPAAERRQQPNPRPRQQGGPPDVGGRGERQLPPSSSRPQRPVSLDVGDESDYDSTQPDTRAAPPPAGASDPRPRPQGRSSAGAAPAAGSPLTPPRPSAYSQQALTLDPGATSRGYDRGRTVSLGSSPMSLAAPGVLLSAPGGQQPGSTWRGEGCSSTRSTSNGPGVRVLTLTQGPGDSAAGLILSASPLLTKRISGTGGGTAGGSGAKKPPVAGRRPPRAAAAAAAEGLSGWENDSAPDCDNPGLDSGPSRGGRGPFSSPLPDPPPRAPGPRAYAQQVSTHAALAITSPHGSSSSLTLRLPAAAPSPPGQAAAEVIARLTQGVISSRGAATEAGASPMDSLRPGPDAPDEARRLRSLSPRLQKQVSGGSAVSPILGLGLGARRGSGSGSGGLLEVGPASRRMPA